jgi:hypothetical protein
VYSFHTLFLVLKLLCNHCLVLKLLYNHCLVLKLLHNHCNVGPNTISIPHKHILRNLKPLYIMFSSFIKSYFQVTDRSDQFNKPIVNRQCLFLISSNILMVFLLSINNIQEIFLWFFYYQQSQTRP